MDVGTVTYSFYVSDYMTASLQQIQGANENLKTSVDQTTASAEKQTIKFMGELMAVMALYSGFRRLGMSLHQMGLISDGNYQKMMKLAAAVGLVVSVFQMFKGVIQLVNQLKSAEIGLAIVETYRAVLHNPAKLGLALAGVAAVGMIGGYLIGASKGGGGTTVNQSVSFGGYAQPSSQRDTARQTLEFAG